MSLKSHLVELRNRLIKSAIALLIGAVIGWILYTPLFAAISEPIKRIAEEKGFNASINFGGITTGFDLHLQGAFFIGAIVSSPVWIYQIWAFIVPGLSAKERRYTFGFMFAAIPLFLAGLYCGWWVMPNVVHALLNFTPDDRGASNLVAATDYITFIMQLILFMGVAFLVPVVLIGVNMAGVLRGKIMFKSWRFTVLGVTLVSAMAAPGNDVFTMFLLAAPLLLLYFGAMLLCVWLDKRRDKRRAKLAEETEETADSATPLSDLDNI
ncbi:twin-arginine translocase subunit TatC [Psychromicrobium lacuslunae]|uniref:Sec-independent protein translocase protein TatC n=1 Tax=Psychromicrobium lacuslunae TaxID=1618207 RepID=A0A0D4BX87_9MICC|nr:twin-arginine translocase subunit TatC [Psychromicrobium lacuslunae]AJT40938.1 preprotein translocase subunit TatC [Psychromicrobium lacuslunae]